VSGPPDLLVAAFHWLEFLGLLGALGSSVVRRLARMPPPITWANPPMKIAFAAAFAGGLGLLVITPSGALGFRVVDEGFALLICLLGRPFVAPFVVAAIVSYPFTGHAASVQPPAGAEFVDAIHILSAGMWAGGILALASLRPPGGWRSDQARVMLERFGRVAFIAFGITALTGVLRATEQLNQVSDLWATSYGLVLSFKTAGVLLMLALSSVGWRRGFPVAGIEAGAAVLVLGATALLAAFPLPA
jgi:putative copper export protein